MPFPMLLMELLKISLWGGIGLDFRVLPPGSGLPTELTASPRPSHLHWAGDPYDSGRLGRRSSTSCGVKGGGQEEKEVTVPGPEDWV